MRRIQMFGAVVLGAVLLTIPIGRAQEKTFAAFPIPPAVVLSYEDNAIVFSNLKTRYFIWRSLTTNTVTGAVVGPGYIGKVTLPEGTALVDDTLGNDPNMNDPRYGGLGGFGIHIARKNNVFITNPYDIFRYTWFLTERMDAAKNHGIGVVASRIIDPPHIGADGLGYLTIENDLSDLYSYPLPILRITRSYAIGPYDAQVLTTVTIMWNGAGPPLYLKEPKLVANSIGPPGLSAPYRYLTVVDDNSKVLERFDLWRLPSPNIKTHQIGFDRRWKIAVSAMSTIVPDIVVTAAGSDGDKTFLWEGPPYGFDAWAQNANAAPSLVQYFSYRYCLQGPKDAQGNFTLTRQWEAVRWASGKAGSPPSPSRPQIGIMFHAWEGGFGYYDCLIDFRAADHQGTSYIVWMQYSLSTTATYAKRLPG